MRRHDAVGVRGITNSVLALRFALRKYCLGSSDGGSESVTLSARERRLCAVGVRAISGSYFRTC